jgi:hypothetical protein
MKLSPLNVWHLIPVLPEADGCALVFPPRDCVARFSIVLSPIRRTEIWIDAVTGTIVRKYNTLSFRVL